LAEDFARYIYLPRLKDSSVLLGAIQDGVSLLTWEQDGFAYADSFDESEGRYRGLRYGQIISVTDASSSSLLVKGKVARKQIDSEIPTPPPPPPPDDEDESTPNGDGGGTVPPGVTQPIRFHGSVLLNSLRVGYEASRVAEEVIAHLDGLVGAEVTVTLEIEAKIPGGVPDTVVRTVTENSRTLKFTSQGFEKE
jgi:hypothetical protein